MGLRVHDVVYYLSTAALAIQGLEDHHTSPNREIGPHLQEVIMSQRIQSIIPAVTALQVIRPGKATTAGFVNVYQDIHTKNIELGTKVFRQERNASNKGRNGQRSARLRYVKTIAVSAEVSL